jgi:hypothetical protein
MIIANKPHTHSQRPANTIACHKGIFNVVIPMSVRKSGVCMNAGVRTTRNRLMKV